MTETSKTALRIEEIPDTVKKILAQEHFFTVEGSESQEPGCGLEVVKRACIGAAICPIRKELILLEYVAEDNRHSTSREEEIPNLIKLRAHPAWSAHLSHVDAEIKMTALKLEAVRTERDQIVERLNVREAHLSDLLSSLRIAKRNQESQERPPSST